MLVYAQDKNTSERLTYPKRNNIYLDTSISLNLMLNLPQKKQQLSSYQHFFHPVVYPPCYPKYNVVSDLLRITSTILENLSVAVHPNAIYHFSPDPNNKLRSVIFLLIYFAHL